MVGALYAAAGTSLESLLDLARDFSPRVEVTASREVALDASGLTCLFGDAPALAAELQRTAVARGLRVRVALAGTRTAARLHVHASAGPTVIVPGTDAASLAPLRLGLLAVVLPASPDRPGSAIPCGGPGGNDWAAGRGSSSRQAHTRVGQERR